MTAKTIQELSATASVVLTDTIPLQKTGAGATEYGTMSQVKTLMTTGTTTNDSASSGQVGEYLSSSVLIGSAVSLTDDTDTNITNLALSAGDWDVTANCFFSGGATTQFFDGRFSISTVSATLNSSNDRLVWFAENTTIFGNGASISKTIGPCRISLAAGTTIFLVARANFSTSTCSGYGIITARRVR